MNSCCAVCVTYNPDFPLLNKGLSSSLNQVERVFVVDNGSRSSVEEFASDLERVEVVSLGENKGIAAAFNVGLRLAKEAGYKYVLLLDQDSVPPEGMVPCYLDAMGELRQKGTPVAAIGPRYRDPQSGHVSRFVRFSWFRNRYIGGDDQASIVPAEFLISSGSFYDLTIFDKIGLFDEELFIDHVDTEWCLRARALGFQCFGVWNIIMEHSLGERRIRLWFLRWRQQPMHKPFRLYFIFRNSIRIYGLSHTSKKWISADVLRLIRLLPVYMFFSPDRTESLRWIVRGAIDGLSGVSGPAPKAEQVER